MHTYTLEYYSDTKIAWNLATCDNKDGLEDIKWNKFKKTNIAWF